VLAQLAPILLLACGQAVVMIAGGLDLSQGSIVGVASVCFVVFSRTGGFLGGLLATLVLAIAIGAANATATKWIRNSFVATFSSMYVLMGAIIYTTGGTPISDMPAGVHDVLARIGSGNVLGIPASLIFASVPVALLGTFLNGSRRGLELFAWGCNATAARIHGIKEMPVLLAAFCVSAILSSLAGILLSARVLQGNPQMGEGLLFESIAACVVGGVALSGGVGGIWAVTRGVVVLAIIQNALYLSDLNSHLRDVAIGVMIAVSVLLAKARLSTKTNN
jgi:ribose transport system permease protein